MSILKDFPKDSSYFNILLDVFQMGLENRLRVLEHQEINYPNLEELGHLDLSGFKNTNFKETLLDLIDASKSGRLTDRITNVVITNKRNVFNSLYVLFTIQTDVKKISLNVTLSLEYLNDSILPSASFEIPVLKNLQNKTRLPRQRKYTKANGEKIVAPYFPVVVESNSYNKHKKYKHHTTRTYFLDVQTDDKFGRVYYGYDLNWYYNLPDLMSKLGIEAVVEPEPYNLLILMFNRAKAHIERVIWLHVERELRTSKSHRALINEISNVLDHRLTSKDYGNRRLKYRLLAEERNDVFKSVSLARRMKLNQFGEIE